VDQVGIANLALGHCMASRIVSVTERTPEARAIAEAWQPAVDACLAAAEWTFATRRVALAAVAGTPPPEWGYQYAIPDNCLQPIRIADSLTTRRNDQRIPFHVETTTADGRLVYTNQPEAVLVYTARVDVTAFSPWFARFVAAQLALDVCLGLTKSRETYSRVVVPLWREMFSAAVTLDNRSQVQPQPPQNEFTAARR